jgi:putative intracellular protease/amidase
MASIADRPILHAAALFAETASKGESATPPRATIGVLAIQGAFLEHITYLRACGAAAREVREPHQFEGLDALVIPGGESTTMAIVAKRRGMVRWHACKFLRADKRTSHLARYARSMAVAQSRE